MTQSNFFKQSLPAIQERLENWWHFGEQSNPCIIAAVDHAAAEPQKHGELKQWWTDAQLVCERQMRHIDNRHYFGEAVPFHYIDLGSSAMAGFCGATLECVDTETVWAHPAQTTLDALMDIELDRSNCWLQAARAIAGKSVSLSNGHHFVAHPALEGIGDILAGLYGTENLLMDMMVRPGDVKRVMSRLMDIWLMLFKEFNEMHAKSGNRGGIGWAGIWAPGTTFPIQEDFSYMISADMFADFCLPHIRSMVDAMEYPFYHLDGDGCLQHLDFLLQIPKLKAIQWQPGAGKQEISRWYDVIKKILAAKKSVQVYCAAEEIDDLVRNVGTQGVLAIVESASGAEVEQLAQKYAIAE